MDPLEAGKSHPNIQRPVVLVIFYEQQLLIHVQHFFSENVKTVNDKRNCTLNIRASVPQESEYALVIKTVPKRDAQEAKPVCNYMLTTLDCSSDGEYSFKLTMVVIWTYILFSRKKKWSNPYNVAVSRIISDIFATDKPRQTFHWQT